VRGRRREDPAETASFCGESAGPDVRVPNQQALTSLYSPSTTGVALTTDTATATDEPATGAPSMAVVPDAVPDICLAILRSDPAVHAHPPGSLRTRPRTWSMSP